MERNYSLDLFRVLSMLMIIILHILGPQNMGGNILSDTSSVNYYIAWFFETFCFCGVNCFAMLSGYLCINKKNVNYKRIFEIYGLIFFYSIMFLIISYPFYKISYKDVYKCFLPLTSRQDWFTTSYFCLFFLIPYINKLLIGLSRTEFKNFLFVIVTLFILLPLLNLNRIDLFGTLNGFSFLWLSLMYCFGAYQRLYPNKVKHSFVIIFISTSISFISKFIIIFVLHSLNINGYEILSMTFIGYTSPFMVVNSYLLLNIFSNKSTNLTPRLQKIILSISSASFAVLMIHTNQCVLKYLTFGRLQLLSDLYPVLFLLVIPIISCLIYLICYFIEKIRKVIFDITKISIVLNKLEDSIMYISRKLCEKIVLREKKYE